MNSTVTTLLQLSNLVRDTHNNLESVDAFEIVFNFSKMLHKFVMSIIILYQN